MSKGNTAEWKMYWHIIIMCNFQSLWCVVTYTKQRGQRTRQSWVLLTPLLWQVSCRDRRPPLQSIQRTPAWSSAAELLRYYRERELGWHELPSGRSDRDRRVILRCWWESDHVHLNAMAYSESMHAIYSIVPAIPWSSCPKLHARECTLRSLAQAYSYDCPRNILCKWVG